MQRSNSGTSEIPVVKSLRSMNQYMNIEKIEELREQVTKDKVVVRGCYQRASKRERCDVCNERCLWFQHFVTTEWKVKEDSLLNHFNELDESYQWDYWEYYFDWVDTPYKQLCKKCYRKYKAYDKIFKQHTIEIVKDYMCKDLANELVKYL